jgi:SNF2 family DNA or RNA helicase
MTPKQKHAYNEMKKDQVVQVESGIVAAFDPMQLNMRLGRFAKAYCQVEDDGKITMSMPSSTVDAVVEIARETTPLVVFSASKQLLNLAQAELEKADITTCRITGDENDRQRKASLEDFNADKAKVILCTLGAGSESLDLSHSSTLVFMMRNYSAIANPQAADRIINMEMTTHPLIIDIVTPGTVDEEIVPALQEKFDIMEELVRDKDALTRRQ